MKELSRNEVIARIEKQLSNHEIITRAEKEPERLKFWIQYYDDYLDACKSVVENPPSFDEAWKTIFPDPKKYKEFINSFSDYYSEDTWISVDEELPKADQNGDFSADILVYNKLHDEIGIGKFDINKRMWWYASNNLLLTVHIFYVPLDDKEITHWQPSPKRPKK